MFPRSLKQLCSPALLYFLVSIVGLIIVAFQNLTSNMNTLQLAGMHMRVPNLLLLFVVKLIYILFWTWILNLICKDGHSGISWLLVLVPFVLMFFVVLSMLSSA
jgi:hypothetical protein